MPQTRVVMGMPIELQIVSPAQAQTEFDRVFSYFAEVDERFSTYKPQSEIMRVNDGEVPESAYSKDMNEVLGLAEKTKQETNGYFNIRRPDGTIDPSGIVKGWAIRNAAQMLRAMGCQDFCINAGGDIQTSGKNGSDREWSVGIKNPFNPEEVVKVIYPRGRGVATSGSYIRGAHIYNPHEPHDALGYIVSLTVVGPDVCEADRFATGAFAMGRGGIEFIENLPGFEAYSIDKGGIATMTSGFRAYTQHA